MSIPCSVCGKTVPSNAILRHERSHNPSYVCGHCGDAFRYKSSHARHLLVKHASAEQQPHECADCGARFPRRDLLHTHSSTHLEANRLQLRLQIARSTALQAELQSVRATVSRLQDESDRLSAATTLAEAWQATDSGAARREPLGFGALSCRCGRYDSARLGAVRRCSTPTCTACFHWVCAGYGRLLSPDAHAPCARCLEASRVPAAAYEDASNEVVLLDAYLAARGLRREPVPADGLCLFAAVSRVTGRATDDLFQETMHTLSQYDFCRFDATLKGADARQLQLDAAYLARRRLRMTARWDTRLMDFAPVVLMERFDLACFEARGRTIRQDPVDRPDVGGRICIFGKGLSLDHYDAVVTTLREFV